MKTGDKVRLLRGTEEGYIKAIKGNIVEIEIEDGFVIPAMKNEVVLVSSQEARYFTRQDEKPEEPKPTPSGNLPKGIHLAIVPGEDLLVINQTGDAVLFSVSQHDKKNRTGLGYGICKPFEITEVASDYIDPQGKPLHFSIQLIIHEQKTQLQRQPQTTECVVSPEKLKSLTYIEKIMKEVCLIRLDEPEEFKIDVKNLRERMVEGTSIRESVMQTPKKVHERIVDLHMDAQDVGLKEHEVLRSQLDAFEKAYDNALLGNVEKLKIIHGVGTGKLRMEIHKRLSNKKEVKFFEDAEKERFGFGATVVHF